MTQTTAEVVYIYGLREVGTEDIRYVGQTENPKVRLAAHMADADITSRNSKAAWIGEVLSRGGSIEMHTLEECVWNETRDREAFWIEYYRPSGILTNVGPAQGKRVRYQHETTQTVTITSSSLCRNDEDDEIEQRLLDKFDRIEHMLTAILHKLEDKEKARLDRHERILQKICSRLGIDLEAIDYDADHA